MKYVAKCPHCGWPHPYTEVRFGAVNDHGYWKLSCQNCENDFVIRLSNPRESFAECYVSERNERAYDGDTAILATDVILHNLPGSNTEHLFDYAAPVLYVCTESNEPLETRARDAFVGDFDAIKSAYSATANYALANGTPPFRHLVAHIAFARCPCGKRHIATFYTKFLFTGEIQNQPEAYLLANVSECDLRDRLDGLHSKSNAIALLEKLLIRWHLTSDQIIVAVPFVGHAYLSKEKKMRMWTWLLSTIDPELGVFITRSRTFADYKKVYEEVAGLNHALLDSYGLANRLIAANTSKQDFHAKFFIGRGSDFCEVFSGSANIVEGPSIENMSFRSMSAARCNSRYIKPLKMSLPAARPRIAHVLVRKDNGRYTAYQRTDSPVAD